MNNKILEYNLLRNNNKYVYLSDDLINKRGKNTIYEKTDWKKTTV